MFPFPKGNIEPGETSEAAALREVKGETGLDVELVEGLREEVEYVYHWAVTRWS